MNRTRTFALSLMLFAFVTGVANASWYDDYDAGLNAARTGNWSAVVQRMTAAIKGNPKEANKAKTYGTIFINYHPFYYRGVAYMNLGRYDDAVADLERATGPGPENLGSIEMLMDSAKTKLKLAAASAPEPEPTPTRPEPVRPAPVAPAPVVPQIDPGLRQRAAAALNATMGKLQAAQQRKAMSSPQYTQAMSMFSDAKLKNAAVKTNDDLNAIIAIAENAGDLADLAAAPAAIATTTPTPAPLVPKPTAATNLVLGEAQAQVRRALENYFAGDFENATKQFQRLADSMPKNGWIWAFLGASQYSQYAFEADESYRAKALKSFREAKRLRSWKGGLPEKYFSKRIRRAFEREG